MSTSTELASGGAASVGRVRAIDAARGLAMVFVCLSHFGLEYFRRLDQPSIADTLYIVGMVGSPTFMLISGIMLGVLYETRRGRFDQHRMLLADRALFMLTVGHVLILVANAPRMDSLAATLQRGFITDVLAIALLLGPTLVSRVSRRSRLVLSLVLFTGGWLLALRWTPATAFDEVVRYLLVGSYPYQIPYNFPLLPWLAVYVAASVLGQWMGERFANGHRLKVERTLLLLGAAAVTSVVMYKVCQWTLPIPPSSLLTVLASPWRKLPPSPAYLLFYGGFSLLLVSSTLIAERRKLVPWLFAWATLFGRTSLFVFILQFYVYYVLLLYLNLPYTPFWPLVFVVSIAGITALAKVWDDGAMNRYLTVGLRRSTTTRVGRLLLGSVGAWWRPRVQTPSGSLKERWHDRDSGSLR
jgi:uncharacterized membrane protein